MVPRLAGASLGLLAFAITVVAGLLVGNPAFTILSRAILSLFVFFVVGLVLGSAAQMVLVDRHRRRERELIQKYRTSIDDGGGVLTPHAAAEEPRVAEGGMTA